MYDKMVKITRTVDGETMEGTCMPSALPAWLSDDWTVVDDGNSGQNVEAAPADEVAPVPPTNPEEI